MSNMLQFIHAMDEKLSTGLRDYVCAVLPSRMAYGKERSRMYCMCLDVLFHPENPDDGHTNQPSIWALIAISRL